MGERTTNVLRDLYTEAGWAAIAAGRSQLRTAASRKMVTKSSIDWEGWEPGDAEAAAKLIGTSKAPGLKNLLDGANVTIKGIEETRYNDLAGVLARSVADGLGVDETAKQIDAMFDKGADWADMVARTETARAVTAGTLDSYADAGVTKVEWLTADGGCAICGEYESMGPVEMDQGFGDVEGPPAHPNCLCTLLPVVSEDAGVVEKPEEVVPDDVASDDVSPEEEIATGDMTVTEADTEAVTEDSAFSPAERTALAELRQYAELAEKNDNYKAYELYKSGSGVFSDGLGAMREFTQTNIRVDLLASPEAKFIMNNAGETPEIVYRGVYAGKLEAELLQVGDIYDNRMAASYTSTEKIAENFALRASEGVQIPVIFESVGPLRGIPLEPITLYPGENEWLVSHSVRVVRIDKTRINGKDGLRVYVEDVAPVKKSVNAFITKAGRNVIDVALAKLNEIPMVDDDHIAVPWPITERPKLDPEVWAEAAIQSVVIANLYASQELLTKERVVFFIENPGAIELGRRAFANVYDLGERLVIVDGHHRLAALWLLGADEANVWFLEE